MNRRQLNTPWTPGEVILLNNMQANHMFHGYTCRDHSQKGNLRATQDGWVCDQGECDYKQTWAHLIVIPYFFEKKGENNVQRKN